LLQVEQAVERHTAPCPFFCPAFAHESGKKNINKTSKNVAHISTHICGRFPTTLSPQSHHVLPRKIPRLRTTNREKPLQNTTSTTRKKSTAKNYQTR